MELIFTMGLSLIVMAASFSAYFSITRADDVERRREILITTANNALGRIKEDVRSAESVSASGSTLALGTSDGRVTYRTQGANVQRIARHGRGLYKGVTASFSQHGAGVEVSVNGAQIVHRRALRVDLNCFIAPRS